MDPKELEIEEGPLSDCSNCQTGNDEELQDNEEGFPADYLLGRVNRSQLDSDEFHERFYRLQVEETLYSSLDSNLEPPNNESTRLGLDIRQTAPGGIVFSPGGSEAFVYPSQNRTVHEKPNRSEVRPEGERPMTVGQAVDDAGNDKNDDEDDINVDVIGSRQQFLQEDDTVVSTLRQPQDQEDTRRSSTNETEGRKSATAASTTTSTSIRDPTSTPSPRRFRIPPGARERFLLQDSENYFNLQSVSEHETTFDADSVAETMSPLMTSRTGAMTDRATSPSMASVTSGHSAASSVGGIGGARRLLEWDSGADLGYAGGLLAQRDAAASLSTLEKLTIGNYSNFFRSEPEGKPSRDRGAASATSQMTSASFKDRDHEDELRQMRLSKYADSLLRQRQFHNPPMKGPPESAMARNSQQTAESYSAQNKPGCSKSDTTPEISPSRRRRRHRKSIAPSQRRSLTSPLRSTSLTDLSKITGRKTSQNANADWFSRKPSPPTHWSEPSSASSVATVVPIQNQDKDQDKPSNKNPMLKTINPDPRSFHPEPQGLVKAQIDPSLPTGYQMGGAVNLSDATARNSQTSLSSRQSASRSFETVIRVPSSESPDTEEELLMIKRSEKMWNSGTRAKSVPKDAENDNYVSNDYEELIIQYGIPKTAWTTSNDETDTNDGSKHAGRDSGGGRSSSGRRSAGQRWAGRSRGNAARAATTSDDDLQNGADARLRERRRPSFPTNCSTMESATCIDRAKSFEYFPGESFPLQENSSSYEYLPGHLVDDRPGTVASKRDDGRRDKSDAGKGQDARDTSEYLTTEDTTSPRSSSSGTERRPKKPTAMNKDSDLDLEQLSRDLLHKTRELHSAHMAQSKDFYKRLKKYIAFVSTPSTTPDECRVKQEVAAKILSLVQKEESKLVNVKPLESDFEFGHSARNDPASEKESDRSESEPTARHIADEASADATDHGGGGMHPKHKRRSRSKSSLSELSAELARATHEPEPVDNMSMSGIDIEVQRLRVEQMRRLRKELRKLEKLERLRLNKAVGGSPSIDAQLLRQINEADAENSFDSVSTANTTDVSTKLMTSSTVKGIITSSTSKGATTASTKVMASSKSDARLGLEGQSATSGSDTNRGAKKSSIRRTSKKVDTSHSSLTKSLTSKKTTTGNVSSDFGQTYPTQRQSTLENSDKRALSDASSSERNKSAMSVDNNRNDVQERRYKRRKPIAFYLPIDQRSPIVIGSRILREKNKEDPIGKENRNLLANYMAGLDSGMKKIKRKPVATPNSAPDSPKSDPASGWTLQESLARRRPDFIVNADFRTQRLSEMKQKRLEYEEQMRQWLANASSVDRTPPVALSYSNAVPRLFDYKSMVKESRRKYLQLPEVQRKRYELQRRSSYRTNRLMASVFRKRLKNRVLRGQVSMSHKNSVI